MQHKLRQRFSFASSQKSAHSLQGVGCERRSRQIECTIRRSKLMWCELLAGANLHGPYPLHFPATQIRSRSKMPKSPRSSSWHCSHCPCNPKRTQPRLLYAARCATHKENPWPAQPFNCRPKTPCRYERRVRMRKASIVLRICAAEFMFCERRWPDTAPPKFLPSSLPRKKQKCRPRSPAGKESSSTSLCRASLRVLRSTPIRGCRGYRYDKSRRSWL